MAGGRSWNDRAASIVICRECIKPLPQEMVFDETDLRYAEVYVFMPLQVQPLKQDGSKNTEQPQGESGNKDSGTFGGERSG